MIYLAPIKGFEDYNILETGEVYSSISKKFLSQFIDNTGYKQVILYKGGKRYYRRVHRLVAENLILNYDRNKTFVDHKDGNKLNNNMYNLEWVTNRENTIRAYNNNLYHSRKNIKIKAIDNCGNEYLFKSIRECSNTLNINRKTLSSILFNNKKNNYNYEFKIVA